MNKIERNIDVINGTNDLENLYCFKDFPVFMGCTDKSSSEDLFFDMNWTISKSSGAIQLNSLLPLEILYKESHGSGTTGKLWNEHHEAFSAFITKYNIKNVLEIGGYHGILANKCIIKNNTINWTIIEPNPILQNSQKIKVVKGFFDENFKSDDDYDSIVHSHLMEHVYDVNKFMNHKVSFMKNGNLLFFSIPNLKVMLEKKYTNCLNFEHTIYLIEPYIEYFLEKYGLKLLNKEYFKDDHSIFYCAQKVDEININSLKSELYNTNKNTFLEYINFHKKDVKDINQKIENTIYPVYLFGAHVFSQFLVSYGLNTKKITSVLDNDSNKHNKRLYGTNLICQSPKSLKNLPNAVVILRAGVYNEEVKNEILSSINSNIIFI